MTKTRFGRVVELVREGADGGRSFSIGLEALEPGTGRLVADPVTDYEGSGVAFQAGDLLFGKLRPYLAKAWLSDRDGAAVGDFHVYRPMDGACPGYLRWVLLSRSFLDPVESSVFGAKMPRADWEFIRNIEIYVPPAIEQRAIADYLDRETARIDTLIEEQQRLIEMLLERRRSVIERETCTGGAAPSEEWPVMTLRRIGRFITGTTPSGDPEDLFDEEGLIGWARPEDLGGRVTGCRRLSEAGAAQIRPARDAVLVCCIGATVGKVGWVSGEIAWDCCTDR